MDRTGVLGQEGAHVLPDLATEQPERVIRVAKPAHCERGRHERDAARQDLPVQRIVARVPTPTMTSASVLPLPQPPEIGHHRLAVGVELEDPVRLGEIGPRRTVGP